MNMWIGRICAWMILFAVIVSTVNAVIRKVVGVSSNSWLELQWYMFSAIFLICASWALLRNDHIRIDIVSARLTQTSRNWIDVMGFTIFLLPLCVVMLYEGWPYFYDTWKSGEQSSNAGGLVRWPVRFLIPLGFGLLLLQGLSELIKRIAIMRGLIPAPVDAKSSHH